MGSVTIGVSVGQGPRPAALAVVEGIEEIAGVEPEPCSCDPKLQRSRSGPTSGPDWRPLGYQPESRWRCQRCGTRVDRVWFVEHFYLRRLEALPGVSYSELVGRVREAWRGVQEREPEPANPSSLVYADLTGLGLPILDALLEAGGAELLALPVYTTHGDRREVADLEGKNPLVSLGKGYLVSRLQLLLQDGRLHLPKGAERVGRELLEVVAEVSPDANDRYGAWRTGPNDHLVTALGLATQLRLGSLEWKKEIAAARRLRRHRLASGKPVDHSLPDWWSDLEEITLTSWPGGGGVW